MQLQENIEGNYLHRLNNYMQELQLCLHKSKTIKLIYFLPCFFL